MGRKKRGEAEEGGGRGDGRCNEMHAGVRIATGLMRPSSLTSLFSRRSRVVSRGRVRLPHSQLPTESRDDPEETRRWTTRNGVYVGQVRESDREHYPPPLSNEIAARSKNSPCRRLRIYVFSRYPRDLTFRFARPRRPRAETERKKRGPMRCVPQSHSVPRIVTVPCGLERS